MKSYILALMILLSLCAAQVFGFEGGDTGTYRILDYEIRLSPKNDGVVNIKYYQKWKVTDGHIPWVTVGVPNDYYSVTDSGKSRQIYSEGSGLVHVDLDRDYQSGETFEVSFSIEQRRLMYPDDNNYKLDFTPGWYDRAAIDSMKITVESPVDLSSVSVSPAPTSQTEKEFVWAKSGLAEGEQFPISMSFPKTAFSISEDNLQTDNGSDNGIDNGSAAGAVFGVIVLIGLIVFFVKYSSTGNGGRYTGGNIYRGGHGGTGCVYSCACACACAGCACACACAGGGGAGCSRKMEHKCPVCSGIADTHACSKK